MANPTILFNSSTGSDSLASGAGPGIALTGSAASTDGAGTLVTLDGSPDLSGVDTTGLAVIYLADTTAGARNFGKITAVDNGAKTVTVSNAFGLSLSGKAWAIGGKRLSLASTSSVKLLSNNSAAGDAMPGWILEFESGYTETITTTVVFRRTGDTTGRIILRGASGGTRPIFTFSNNGAMFQVAASVNNILFKFFELKNSNATKTASIGINLNTGDAVIEDIKCNDSSNKVWKAISINGSGLVRDCDLGYCASTIIDVISTAVTGPHIINNYIHHGGADGILIGTTTPVGISIRKNVIAFNTGDGIEIAATLTNVQRSPLSIIENTIHGNGSDGIEFSSAATQEGVYQKATIESNQFTRNGGYAVNFTGASVTNDTLVAENSQYRNNNHHSNTSGWSNLTTTFDEATTNNDPSGGLTSSTKDYAGVTDGSDFRIVSTGKGLGYPLGGSLNVGKSSSTTSYVDQGASQRQEVASTSYGHIIGS